MWFGDRTGLHGFVRCGAWAVIGPEPQIAVLGCCCFISLRSLDLLVVSAELGDDALAADLHPPLAVLCFLDTIVLRWSVDGGGPSDERTLLLRQGEAGTHAEELAPLLCDHLGYDELLQRNLGPVF